MSEVFLSYFDPIVPNRPAHLGVAFEFLYITVGQDDYMLYSGEATRQHAGEEKADE